MSRVKDFIPLNEDTIVKKDNSIEMNFTVNEFYAMKKQKERPENQLEPSLNEIQRFSKWEP